MKKFVSIFALALFASLVPLSFAQDNLPAGKGRDTFKKVCTQCHDVEGVPQLRYSRADWASLVYSMKDMGADATKAELEEIIDYLAKNFGKDEKK
jgi:cytochrome c553